MNEKTLRDYLAEHLDLLEYGMSLVMLNRPLANSHGTRGYIDILARDRRGMLVVVEVKRSNSTAREALHEVHKYVELLHREDAAPAARHR